MGRYSYVRSIEHGERILRRNVTQVRRLSEEADDNGEALRAAALRGKAVAYGEAADLLGVLGRKFTDGELDETRSVAS